MPYNALNGNRLIASIAYSGATAKLEDFEPQEILLSLAQ